MTDDVSILSSEPFDSVIVHGSGCGTQDECLVLLEEGRVCSPVTFLIIEPAGTRAELVGLERAAVVGCSTKADWAHARARGAEESRLAQITHGVDVLSATGLPGFRKRHGIEPSSRLFLSAGGFGAHKRMLELARAFGRARGPRDTLVLFGYQQHQDGEAYVEQCGAVDGVVVLFGKPRQEVMDALLEADLYCMHSAHEGSGLLLLEAMLNGCPWASCATAGAASDLHRFGQLYSAEHELAAIIRSARPLQPMRRAALRHAAIARYSVRTSVDELHRALAEHVPTGAFAPAPPPLQPVDDPPLMAKEEAGAQRACFATFLHGDSGYFLGVLALKRSLDAAGCRLPLLVAVTSSVPSSARGACAAEWAWEVGRRARARARARVLCSVAG